jgi:hypothetical protein
MLWIYTYFGGLARICVVFIIGIAVIRRIVFFSGRPHTHRGVFPHLSRNVSKLASQTDRKHIMHDGGGTYPLVLHDFFHVQASARAVRPKVGLDELCTLDQQNLHLSRSS